MDFLYFLYIFGTIIYCFFIFSLIAGLNRLKVQHSGTARPFVSVIIPARNEENNIVPCLEALVNQTYPQHLYEIIVVDDASTDATKHLVREFADRHNNISLLELEESNTNVSPKKRAIEAGVRESRGEIIFTTDADCRVPSGWLETLLRYFDKDTGLVFSWLLVNPGDTLLSKLESLDSFGLVLVGASACGLGFPFLANGANLAYRKSLFTEINGFQGNEHIASGDDDLLLQKIIKQSNLKAVFAPDRSASVRTEANHTLKAFFSQRVRWASKSGSYPLHVLGLEIFIYCFFLLLLLTIPLLFVSFVPLIFLVTKLLLDYIIINKGCKLLNRPLSLVRFLTANLFQMAYILFVSIAGLVGQFSWKGRCYQKGKPAASGK